MRERFCKTPMRKMLSVVGVLFLLLFSWYAIKKVFMWWFMAHYQPPPVTISSVVAKRSIWQNYFTAIGTLTAVNGVDITSEVAGIVKEIHFTSGQFVQKGSVLIILDNRVEQANLKDNQAKLKLAEINYERDKKLFQKNVVARAAFDTTTAQLEEAQAGVEGMLARIDQKTIEAPFDGKLGIRLVDLGQYVSPGTAMVTLQSLNPLYVQFSLPEQYLNQLYISQPVDISVNLGAGITAHGTITAINAKVDQNTRNVLVEATIPNDKLELFPGMFASVKVWTPQKNNVISLPQTAIAYSLYGDYVFLMKPDDNSKKEKPIYRVTRQYVSLGERRGDEVIITKGLNAGDQVVSLGQLKLQNNARVVVNNSVE